MSVQDWTPTQVDPARRLVQVRMALEILPMSREHWNQMAEFAWNLEKKITQPATRAQKGK